MKPNAPRGRVQIQAPTGGVHVGAGSIVVPRGPGIVVPSSPPSAPSSPAASDCPYDPADILENYGTSGAFYVAQLPANAQSIARLRTKRTYPMTLYATVTGSVLNDPTASGVQGNYTLGAHGFVPRVLVRTGVGKTTRQSVYPLGRSITFIAEYLEAFAVVLKTQGDFAASDLFQDAHWGAVWNAAIGIGECSEPSLPTVMIQGGQNAYSAFGFISPLQAGTLYSLTGYNAGASGSTYLQLYDISPQGAGVIPVNGAIADWEQPILAGQSFSLDFGTRGRDFGSGLLWICSSTPRVLTYDSTQTMRVDGEIGVV